MPCDLVYQAVPAELKDTAGAGGTLVTRLLPHLAACCALALIAASASAQQPNLAKGPEAARVKRGYEIAPVRLKKRGLDPDLVGLGSYLVNAAGGCNDCHSVDAYEEGGDPFKSEPERINKETYLAGGRSFGIAVSPNLTPDDRGRPAGLTYKKFYNAIKFGKDPDEGDILQVMPWPVFRNLTDRDIRAIYVYLKAIPSLDTPTTLQSEPVEPQPEATPEEPEGTFTEELPSDDTPEDTGELPDGEAGTVLEGIEPGTDEAEEPDADPTGAAELSSGSRS